MNRTAPRRWNLSASLVLALLFITFTLSAQAQVALVQLSTDTFTNASSQHKTEVEPDTLSFGSTIVTAFQVGRISNGGASDIGFATSTNGGVTWSNGFLPGITIFMGGSFSAASDPAVAFDLAHNQWIIVSLGLASQNVVLTSNSSDAINWNNPVTVNSNTGFADKTWIVCDNWSGSPFFGHCYVEWDDALGGPQVKMSTSTDGGQTWSAAANVPGAFGLGGQPVVQPTGTVVVPFEGNGIQAFLSTNGGTSWGNVSTVSNITDHMVAGNMRTETLPSAEMDANGTVYVAWQDCRFRPGCKNNDIVFSSSSDGKTWSAVSRIPIDATTSTVDHFIPGLAVDRTTSGSTAHLALTYYFFPVANCTSSTCKLMVGFVSSPDGGKTWTKALRLAGPMKTGWLPNTTLGRMVGDYISTSFVNGKAFGVFAKATQPTGTVFNEAMFTTTTGLDLLAGPAELSSAGEQPVPNAHSDHGPRRFLDLEGRVPVPPIF